MRLEYFDGERAKGVLLIYAATSLEIESLLTAFDRLRSEHPPRNEPRVVNDTRREASHRLGRRPTKTLSAALASPLASTQVGGLELR